MKCRRRHDAVFANAHFALRGVLRRIPGAKHHLIPILEKLVMDATDSVARTITFPLLQICIVFMKSARSTFPFYDFLDLSFP